jgi:hypothetical protein
LRCDLPLDTRLKEELVKLYILRIIEERCSDMNDIIQIILLESLVPGTSFGIIADDHKGDFVFILWMN